EIDLPPKQPIERRTCRLQIDVSPQGIVPWWDGNPMGTIRKEYLENALNNLARQEPLPNGHPAASAMLGGGLGLFVKNVVAQSSTVPIERLPCAALRPARNGWFRCAGLPPDPQSLAVGVAVPRRPARSIGPGHDARRAAGHRRRTAVVPLDVHV